MPTHASYFAAAPGLPARKFSRERDDETVPLPVPDEAWTFTDRAGHVHRCEPTPPHYPTLVEKRLQYEDHDDDCQAFVHVLRWHECRDCGEAIRPGAREGTVTVAGPTRYLIDDAPVDRGTFIRSMSVYITDLEARYHRQGSGT